MRKKDYIELLENSKLREHILPIYNLLEKYIEPSAGFEYTPELLDEIRISLEDVELKKHITAIAKEAKLSKNSVLPTLVRSLQLNIAGYAKMDTERVASRKIKLAKILRSYINVTRNIIGYDALQEIIQSGAQNGQKIVLAIAMLNVEDDDIKVNDEIDRIVELSGNNLDDHYFVIPIHGCTTNVFTTISERIFADIIHICGHVDRPVPNRYVLEFSDANMSYAKFCEKINLFPGAHTDRELIFLNCCYSYEYINADTIAGSRCTIAHKGPVGRNIAYDTSELFYGRYFVSPNLQYAWNEISDPDYRKLP